MKRCLWLFLLLAGCGMVPGRNTELAKVKAERILVENEIHQCGTARNSVEKSRKALFELETELEPLRAEIAELEKKKKKPK